MLAMGGKSLVLGLWFKRPDDGEQADRRDEEEDEQPEDGRHVLDDDQPGPVAQQDTSYDKQPSGNHEQQPTVET